MQKIVITKGGGNSFSLSTKMLTRYFELSNLPKPYFYERKFSHSVNIHSEYIRVDNLDNYFYMSLNDLGDILRDDSKLYSKENYFDQDTILRDDINLIQAVEEIKPEGLKIVEIPDDVKWYIFQDDDGSETINEVHRSWF